MTHSYVICEAEESMEAVKSEVTTVCILLHEISIELTFGEILGPAPVSLAPCSRQHALHLMMTRKHNLKTHWSTMHKTATQTATAELLFMSCAQGEALETRLINQAITLPGDRVNVACDGKACLWACFHHALSLIRVYPRGETCSDSCMTFV